MKRSQCEGVHRTSAKICVIFPGALGDFICFLPALEALRRGAPVDLYARSEFADLLPAGIGVRSIHSTEISALFRPETPACRGADDLWRTYEAVYSWHGSGDPVFVRRLAEMTDHRSRCFPFRPTEPSGHQSNYYLRCIGAVCRKAAYCAIPVRQEAARWAEHFWSGNGFGSRPVLALAPGSGAREKNWRAEFFLSVAEWWREAIGGDVLLLIGPVERERGGLGRLPTACIDAGQLSLAQAAALLARSTIYLGNDSGISHLAGALGIRTVALFGPSDPLQWAPRGERVTVLRRSLDCSPCGEAVRKICPHHSCLENFSPGEVIAELARLPEAVILTR